MLESLLSSSEWVLCCAAASSRKMSIGWSGRRLRDLPIGFTTVKGCGCSAKGSFLDAYCSVRHVPSGLP